MKSTDEEVAEAWRETQNFAEVGRKLGLHRNTVAVRVIRMRAAGVDLPPPRKRGYTLTSERSKELNELRRRKAGNVAPDV